MERRRFLAGVLAGVAALLVPSPVWAHHRPGHAGGPPPGRGNRNPEPEPATVDSPDVLVDDPVVLVA